MTNSPARTFSHRPMPNEEATSAQLGAIAKLLYRKSGFFAARNSDQEIADEILDKTGIAVESMSTLDRRTASKIITSLSA